MLDRLAQRIILHESTSDYPWDPDADGDVAALLQGMACPAYDPHIADISAPLRGAQCAAFCAWKASMAEKTVILKSSRMEAVTKVQNGVRSVYNLRVTSSRFAHLQLSCLLHSDFPAGAQAPAQVLTHFTHRRRECSSCWSSIWTSSSDAG